jgi:anti-anti-sigma regulatory factor
MNVKIDTKEKFHELTLREPVFTANMTADFDILLSELLEQPPKNVVLNFQPVENMEEEAARWLMATQQKFYEQNASFVICHVLPALEEALDDMELLELMNITPTLSEAWDIVQMEEIERDLMDDF